MRTLIFTFLFISLATIGRANNGTGETAGRPIPELNGGVVDGENKKPLPNVSVSIISHDTKEKKQVSTDNNGSFYFNEIKAGNYKIVFQKDGYKKIVREKVYLREDEPLQLNVEMTEADNDFQLFPNIILGLVGSED